MPNIWAQICHHLLIQPFSSTTPVQEILPEKVPLPTSYSHFYLYHSQIVQIERERAVKWSKMLVKWDRYWGTDKLHRRVNKGIPDSVRGEVWKHVLNIDGVKQEVVYEVCTTHNCTHAKHVSSTEKSITNINANTLLKVF